MITAIATVVPVTNKGYAKHIKFALLLVGLVVAFAAVFALSSVLIGWLATAAAIAAKGAVAAVPMAATLVKGSALIAGFAKVSALAMGI